MCAICLPVLSAFLAKITSRSAHHQLNHSMPEEKVRDRLQDNELCQFLK